MTTLTPDDLVEYVKEKEKSNLGIFVSIWINYVIFYN